MWSSARARQARAAIVASLVAAYSDDGSPKPISSSLPPPGSVVVLRDAGSARKGLACDPQSLDRGGGGGGVRKLQYDYKKKQKLYKSFQDKVFFWPTSKKTPNKIN